MSDEDVDLPTGWVRWHGDPEGECVFVFRPDVFDSAAFPAPCLPTLYVSGRDPGRRRRRAGEPAGDEWHVALFLEPEVRVRDCDRRRETRAAALEAAREVASAFAAGEVDYRAAYQVPREAYLDELDDRTG